MLRKARILPLVALAALSFSGCFGGEDEADSNPILPRDSTRTGKTISPGFYVGDYTPFDSTSAWESEFTLTRDGSYRFYWIYRNEAIGDMKGSWFQRDSSLYFHGSGESFMNQNSGLFDPHLPVENDTNAVRNVTDTSFTRLEWTLLRQKPFWVTYRKKSLPGLGSGKYEFSQDIRVDDTTNLALKVRITLDGDGFLYSVEEDARESLQFAANWYLLGSVFTTEGNRRRAYVDSLNSFTPWDSLSGALLQRIRVSDTAMEVWYPSDGFTPASWTVYRKVE